MAKRENSDSEMAHARQSDGINVIFDQQSPALSHSCSRSRSRSSGRSRTSTDRHRGRSIYRRRYRSSSSSSSSSSRSTSHNRSRSHPRCHRPASRCRCGSHYRSSRGYSHRSPRRYTAHSHSYSRSPSVDRYSHSRRYRSRSKSSRRLNNRRKEVSRVSRSPSRTCRGRSRSSGHSISLSIDDKLELLKSAKENAAKMLGVETLALPESVKPVLSDQSVHGSSAPEMMRQEPEETLSQNEAEPDDVPSPRMSPKRRMISFSINNSVAKPTVAAPPCAKVTPRVDSYESRKPYGHWVPVKSRKTSARKHTRNTSH